MSYFYLKSRKVGNTEFTHFVHIVFRCDVLEDDDPNVIYRALPTLVRLVKKDYPPKTRILAADTLAYLIENSQELQRLAAISNHLIPTIASFLVWDPNSDHCNNFIEMNGFQSR